MVPSEGRRESHLVRSHPMISAAAYVRIPGATAPCAQVRLESGEGKRIRPVNLVLTEATGLDEMD